MRKVKVLKWKQGDDGEGWGKHPDGTAWFHAWGVDYENEEGGPGNFSTAIIERDDGTVENVPANLVTFIKDESLDLTQAEKDSLYPEQVTVEFVD